MVILRLLRRGLLLMMFAVALSFATEGDNTSNRIDTPDTDNFVSRFLLVSISAFADTSARVFLRQKGDRAPVAAEVQGGSSPAAAGALTPTSAR